MKIRAKIIEILKRRFRFEDRDKIEMFLDVDKATEDILELLSQQKKQKQEMVEEKMNKLKFLIDSQEGIKDGGHLSKLGEKHLEGLKEAYKILSQTKTN